MSRCVELPRSASSRQTRRSSIPALVEIASRRHSWASGFKRIRDENSMAAGRALRLARPFVRPQAAESLFPDVLVPQLGPSRDELTHQFYTLRVVRDEQLDA